MKKTITETKTITQEFIEDIICNKCGESCKVSIYYYSHLSVSQTWGFGSKKDCQQDSWDICEKCYDEFVKTFKIEPEYIDRW